MCDKISKSVMFISYFSYSSPKDSSLKMTKIFREIY